MAGKLVAEGDPPAHVHDLPRVPFVERPSVRFNGRQRVETMYTVPLVNAVARCEPCGQLFVSRSFSDEYQSGVRWVTLRWWHRAARRKLRAQGVTS